MVTTLNIPLDDSDYTKILSHKGDKTWREFLLGCCDEEKKTSGGKL